MDIKYAILGLLSLKAYSGYDLKKTFSDSITLYWSGNNNQIYKKLVELLSEGLVTNEIQSQENYPAKKIYYITDKGSALLREWVKAAPEPPEFRNGFLIQLTWADQLNDEELSELIEKYEYEVEMQLLMHNIEKQKKNQEPARTEQEAYLWRMIEENVSDYYSNELNWINKLKSGLSKIRNSKKE